MKLELSAGTYIVAVSGGVDSVVLLDLLARDERLQLIVAHFDHGIREDSAQDALFVERLAKTHGLRYVAKREELGRGVSEERARERRYAFLRAVADEYRAQIVTAHHADDSIETIAINLMRGTGWRGLAVLDNPSILRPLLPYRKRELLAYAKTHNLAWHEDSTNSDESYLRNKLRTKIAKRLSDNDVLQLLALRAHQCANKKEIDERARELIGVSPYSRYFFVHSSEPAALELLRAVCLHETGSSPTIPQRKLALLAIKVAKPGTLHDIGGGIKLTFTSRNFTVVDG